MVNEISLAGMLVLASDWICEHRLGTGVFHDSPEPEFDDAIFVNGNFARVLICTYELTGHHDYLDEAIGWCDHFVNVAAMPVRTSRGNQAVWWWDYDHRNLYLADTGTAVHALFKIFPYVDAARQAKYLDALRKFYLLISEGTDCDPMGRGQEPSPGWIVESGPDAGCFGVGYRKGRLERRPYTISTATAGAQACAAIYHLTREQRCRTTALNAANWLLREFEQTGDGHMRYRIEGGIDLQHFFQGIHYSLEGLLTSWLYLDDEAFRARLHGLAPMILEFVLRHQNEQGYWGTQRAYDGQRSAFLAHFLDWYHRNVAPDPRAAAGARRFAEYVLNPDNTAAYGILNIVNVTGFVSLVFASFLHSQLDIRHPQRRPPLLAFTMDELRATARQWEHASTFAAAEDGRSIE